MPLRSRTTLYPRLRPAAPSCRGGASSLLRLAQPNLQGLSGWLGRAADLALPARELHARAHADFVSSIITLLRPSHELARR